MCQIIPFPKAPVPALPPFFGLLGDSSKPTVLAARSRVEAGQALLAAEKQRHYWHENGRVMQDAAPPMILTTDDIKYRLNWFIDQLELAVQLDKELTFNFYLARFDQLMHAKCDANKWKRDHGDAS